MSEQNEKPKPAMSCPDCARVIDETSVPVASPYGWMHAECPAGSPLPADSPKMCTAVLGVQDGQLRKCANRAVVRWEIRLFGVPIYRGADLCPEHAVIFQQQGLQLVHIQLSKIITQSAPAPKVNGPRQ